MSGKIEEINRYIDECPFKTLDFRKEDVMFLLSEIDTLRARLEAAEKVCETAEELEIAQEPLSVLTAEIKQEKALAAWRKVKEGNNG